MAASPRNVPVLIALFFSLLAVFSTRAAPIPAESGKPPKLSGAPPWKRGGEISEEIAGFFSSLDGILTWKTRSNAAWNPGESISRREIARQEDVLSVLQVGGAPGWRRRDMGLQESRSLPSSDNPKLKKSGALRRKRETTHPGAERVVNTLERGTDSQSVSSIDTAPGAPGW